MCARAVEFQYYLASFIDDRVGDGHIEIRRRAMDFLRDCHQTLKVWGTPRIGDRYDDILLRDCRKGRGISRSGIDPLDEASCNVEKLCAAHFEVQIGIEKWEPRAFIDIKDTYFTPERRP